MAFSCPVFLLHLCSSRAGTEVQGKRDQRGEMGCVSQLRSPFSPLERSQELTIRSRTGAEPRMAPTWMTMVYIFQLGSSSGVSSELRRCAVCR